MLTNCPEMLVPDILWSVNKLDRSVTKWTQVRDKRIARLISYIHHTSNYNIVMWVTRLSMVDGVGSKTQILLVTLRNLNDPRVESYVPLEAEHLFPISWMCKKETSISHSSTECDIILLDAGMRMGGLPALDLWDVVFDVFPRKRVRVRRPSHQ